MIAVFEDVNKLEKLIVSNPCNSEFTVFVRVKMDSLNDFSKFKFPELKKLERIKILIKKDIKTKNEELIFSVFILFSVFKILWSIIMLGVTSFTISKIEDFNKI